MLEVGNSKLSWPDLQSQVESELKKQERVWKSVSGLRKSSWYFGEELVLWDRASGTRICSHIRRLHVTRAHRDFQIRSQIHLRFPGSQGLELPKGSAFIPMLPCSTTTPSKNIERITRESVLS